MPYTAGLDAGSVSVKLALLDSDGRVLHSEYTRHKGRPLLAAAGLLQQAVAEHPDLRLAVTGSAGKYIAQRLGAPHVNELLALAAACGARHPEVRTVIEMGGEDSKLLTLENGAVKDFSLNSVCAAGTGSFLDQQAERMRLSIEEFADLALKSKHPPRIAGRCSVFAKSDMIHLQQIATSMQDIVAGLCFSVARNFKGAIVRNRPMPPKVAFMGGVALNQGMVRAFTEVFGLDDLLVPDPPTTMGAVGAALKAMAQGDAAAVDPDRLAEAGKSVPFRDTGHPPLVQAGDEFKKRHLRGDDPVAEIPAGRTIPAYLGVDIGSISTCLAAVDEEGSLLAKRYLRTASQPIEAVQTGLREIGEELGGRVDIRGVGTTGSGRYMIADFINADVVKNEITAHARGAAHIDPGVDTIFEIGGQDSKYIQLKDGIITDFEMNKACAAGTGSFLEEQADKLEVSVKDEFAGMALAAEAPCRLGERCTVFMENSLQASLQRGAGRDDLLAGLAYSIVENYINRVVAGRAIGSNIFFQGGTAFNKAVVAAFEKYLGTRVTVPPHHDNTGAIGMALLARDHMRAQGLDQSSFRGFDLADKRYSQDSFECKGCENRCEINRVKIEGEATKLFYGGRCEKYDVRQKAGHHIEDLFAFRQEAQEAAHTQHEEAFRAAAAPARRGVIGIPRVFFFYDYLPWFATLLWELGFEVRLSPRTTASIASLGARSTLADSCYPIKVSLGHMQWLLDNGVQDILLPSFINMTDPDSAFDYGHACPLTQSFPYQARTAFPTETTGARIHVPIVQLKHGRRDLAKELQQALQRFGVGRAELSRAMDRAQAEQERFQQTIKERGRRFLDELNSRALVIIGRPYNAFDSGMNLEIPKKLATLGVRSIPMDFLPDTDIAEEWPDMYWRSGQRILSAIRFVKDHPRLSPLYIGNFSCGPDSFIQKYVEKELAGKPYLHIEIDEHSADAGVVTRCEAFLDSLQMQDEAGDRRVRAQPAPPPRRTAFYDDAGRRRRTVYIPRMCDHAFAMQTAFQACGVDAEVLPETDEEAIALGRKWTSGKECYPFAVTTGDMLKRATAPDFDPEHSAFLMPSGTGPCRFGQYNVAQRLIMERAGFSKVPILSPEQDSAIYDELGLIGSDFSRTMWRGLIAIDLLTKCLHETRPYERQPGAADRLYQESLELVKNEILSGNGNLPAVMERVRDSFRALPADDEPKPLIGIVGEIFVRSNKFSNENLVRRVEALGGEAWLAPVDEWAYYVNWGSIRNALRRRDYKSALKIWLKNRVQTKEAHKLEHAMDGLLKTIHDPGTEKVLENASPYLHDSFRGEAVLSIGKALDMVDRGCVGIVNAMPFGCMPGTVVTSLLRGISQRLGVPAISIPYDGTESPTMQLQLEAFMEQARQAAERRQDSPLE